MKQFLLLVALIMVGILIAMVSGNGKATINADALKKTDVRSLRN